MLCVVCCVVFHHNYTLDVAPISHKLFNMDLQEISYEILAIRLPCNDPSF